MISEPTIIYSEETNNIFCPNYHSPIGYPLRIEEKQLQYVCPQCEPTEQVYIEEMKNVSDERLKEMFRYFSVRKQQQGLVDSSKKLLSKIRETINNRDLDVPDTEVVSVEPMDENEILYLKTMYPEIQSLVVEKDQKNVVPLTRKQKELVVTSLPR